VTILALGGLLLPLLLKAGYPENRGISLVTSASALGVLLAPSVPLIMYAIIARVPINTMFLAGLVPALVMVAFLLIFGGYLRPVSARGSGPVALPVTARPALGPAVWAAKWEILAPVVAIGTLVTGLATPTESAAVTALYAILTQALGHRELGWRLLGKCLSESAQIIGGVLLILGMALALTNYLIDAGIPDAAIEAVQTAIPNKFVFMVALTLFLLLAGALMEMRSSPYMNTFSPATVVPLGRTNCAETAELYVVPFKRKEICVPPVIAPELGVTSCTRAALELPWLHVCAVVAVTEL
jgi:tripartite ATP-independent transporter DctM subunit